MARKTRGAMALAAVAAGLLLTTTACGGGSSTDSSGKTVVTWWHNANNDPGKSFYAKVAKDYEKTHPDVTINISAMDHESMLTKLDAAFQSGDPEQIPDVYMERGGGELADHVKAGLTEDLSSVAKPEIQKLGGSVSAWQVDGKTYALPFNMGLVGFFYNKDLFKQAGITAAPTTLDELNADISKLKAKGITPLSVGAKDKWPLAHYYYYFSVRECSKTALQSAMTSLKFSDPCFVKAGEDLQKFAKQDPFNKGYLTTPAQTGATSASGLLATGKVAMELAGQWEPGVMQGLTADKKGLGDKTGWFTFPSVPGEKGDPQASMGGGDAWAVSTGAPKQTKDFVRYLLSATVEKGVATNNIGLPTNPEAYSAVSDPTMQTIMKKRDSSPYVQLYFDTAFGEQVGGAMNDAIVNMVAGKGSPKDIVKATQQAADDSK